MDTQANAPKTQKLDHLPVIAQAMQRLRLREVIDEIVPPHPRNVVTTGQCIEGMITSILLGVHTLYRVDEVLEPFDLELAFGLDRAVSSRHFNDERLAKALDDLYGAGTSTIYTRFTIEAVRNYDLDLSRIHIDMTSVKLYGLYELSQEPVDAEDPQAIPHIARGRSKAHRPDLKQVVYGLAVSGDGPVPFFGRVASGNRADPKELRFHITQLAEVLPDPRNTILVGDTKLFCGKTLLLLKKYGFDYVTSVPRSFELWELAYAAFEADYPMDETAPVLKGKVNRWGIYERWRGQSYDLTYEYEEEVEGDDGKTEKVLHHIPVRALVVESSALREKKRPGLESWLLRARHEPPEGGGPSP